MTLAKPEGVDPKYLKLSYLLAEGALSRRDLLSGPLVPRYVVVPAVEAESCAAWKGCAQCVAACPQQAIAIDGGEAAIDKAKCIGCGACLPVCPVSAIRQPLLNPDRLEAELRALLPRGETSPGSIVFLVADGGLPPAGPDGLPALSLPSIGAVSAWLLLRTFTLGADGVAVLPCLPGCRHRCDQARWELTLRLTRELLVSFGIGTDRLVVVKREDVGSQQRIEAFRAAVAAMGPRRLRSSPGLRGNGTPSLAEILRDLAALAPEAPAPLIGDGVPFGMVRVQAARCTLCGACPERCPTDALALREAEESRLLFDHTRCIACGACVRVCPEEAVTMERRLEFGRLGSITVLAEDQIARCQRCGVRIAPLSMLRKVQSALGGGTPASPDCPSCRMLQSLGAARG